MPQCSASTSMLWASQDVVLNGKRNCHIFLKSACMFPNKQFLHQHSYTCKSFLCHPSNSWPPFGKQKCIPACQGKCMVCLLFKNNMMRNVRHTLRIYCPFLLQFLSVGGSPHELHVLTSHFCGSHQIGPLHARTCRPWTGGQLYCISCEIRGLRSFHVQFPIKR